GTHSGGNSSMTLEVLRAPFFSGERPSICKRPESDMATSYLPTWVCDLQSLLLGTEVQVIWTAQTYICKGRYIRGCTGANPSRSNDSVRIPGTPAPPLRCSVRSSR